MNPGDVFTIDYSEYYINIICYKNMLFVLRCNHDFALAPKQTLLTDNNQSLVTSSLALLPTDCTPIILDKICDEVFWNFLTSIPEGLSIAVAIVEFLIENNLLQDIEDRKIFKTQLAELLRYKNE